MKNFHIIVFLIKISMFYLNHLLTFLENLIGYSSWFKLDIICSKGLVFPLEALR
jgi:hypothetical protein